MRRRPRLVFNPVAAYFKSRLHRRLFGFFGLAILCTGAAVAAVMVLLGGGAPTFRTEIERITAFAAERFAVVWSSPVEREALARSMVERLDVDVVLVDPTGAELVAYGERCAKPSIKIPVAERGGAALGEVRLCIERHRPHAPWRTPLALLAAGLVLWALSGKVARRLSHPIAELARVAEDIGAGRLSSRAPVSCRQPGEVGVLFKAVNDMAARIEKQMADQRELLAAVSHEIRTPLARIRLLVELARDNGATAANLDELDREVVEIDRLVGELLASSRLDFAALTPTRLDAREVAARAVERAGLDAKLLEEGGAGAAFEADATLVARALANLLENARSHGDGVVAVRVRVEEGLVRFEVDDRGKGFEPGEEIKAFASFYSRASGAGQDNGSLGLGLALVKRIAEAHGGSAFAENRPGGGARVGIWVPSKRESASRGA